MSTGPEPIASPEAAAQVRPPFAWRKEGDILWLAAELDGAHAAFSTRRGGVSEGVYRSLNLGILTRDTRDRVIRNRDLLAAVLERDPEAIAMGLQVHGAEVQVRDTPAAGPDAYAHPGSALVLVADCAPLILAVRGAVAAVHCGWRGVATGVVERALDAVCALGGCGAQSASAAIGPGIGACCYEVGEDVRRAFLARGHRKDVIANERLDIALAVRRELERRGVGEERIAACGLCTSCNPNLFFSHRRDGGVTGRQAGLAWLGTW
jgi:polyphenol oxidase